MGTYLDVTERPLDHGIRLVVLRGQLDSATISLFASRLRKVLNRNQPVVVDLTDVSAVGAAGMALLRNAQRRYAVAGGCLAVVSPDTVVPSTIVSATDPPVATRPGTTTWVTLDVFANREQAIVAARRSVIGGPPCAVRGLLDVPIG
jgi:anti-anti-sigma factor